MSADQEYSGGYGGDDEGDYGGDDGGDYGYDLAHEVRSGGTDPTDRPRPTTVMRGTPFEIDPHGDLGYDSAHEMAAHGS